MAELKIKFELFENGKFPRFCLFMTPHTWYLEKWRETQLYYVNMFMVMYVHETIIIKLKLSSSNEIHILQA